MILLDDIRKDPVLFISKIKEHSPLLKAINVEVSKSACTPVTTEFHIPIDDSETLDQSIVASALAGDIEEVVVASSTGSSTDYLSHFDGIYTKASKIPLNLSAELYAYKNYTLMRDDCFLFRKNDISLKISPIFRYTSYRCRFNNKEGMWHSIVCKISLDVRGQVFNV